MIDDRKAYILDEVTTERMRQDAQWGPHWAPQPFTWMTILMETVGEACRAALDETFDDLPRSYRQELIQVAAVAVAAVECFDRLREESDD